MMIIVSSSNTGYDTLSLWNDVSAAEFSAAETNKRVRKRKKNKV
jgi:hypothetical protein